MVQNGPEEERIAVSCTVPRVLVIGLGDVGRRLLAALDHAGVPAQGVTRTSGWDAALAPELTALRIVAVREEQLAEVLNRFPGDLRQRLVLVQNGFLESRLGDLGRLERGLIWFTSKGDFFRPLAPSLFYGPSARGLAEALERGGLPSRPLESQSEFLKEMIIKGLFNSVVGLPLAIHQLTLAEYLAQKEDEWRALLEEGTAATAHFYGIEVTAAEAAQRLRSSTEPIGWTRGGTKALPFRNGALARMGRRAGIPTPTHDRLLRAAGCDPDQP